METKALSEALRAARFRLFDRSPYGAKNCAQANLSDRCHYVDESTLRFFHCRITSASIQADGAAFYLVQSRACDYANTRREFAFAVFDVEGRVIFATPQGEGFKTAEQAKAAFRKWWAAFDLAAYYAETMARSAETQKRAAAELAKHAKALARKLAK